MQRGEEGMAKFSRVGVDDYLGVWKIFFSSWLKHCVDYVCEIARWLGYMSMDADVHC
jgi:hypothetical protein